MSGSNGRGNGRGDAGASGTAPGGPAAGARAPGAASLPKRFYTTATAAGSAAEGWRVQLDGRPVRTPGKQVLQLASAPLAEVLAGEWSAQATHIDPASMPLTRLVNTALDGVTGREKEVADDIVAYSGSDLLCYRAERPEGLVARQQAAWDPPLAWAQAHLGVSFVRQQGLMPVAQPPGLATAMAAALAPADAIELTALHVVTTLTGSAVLALAVWREAVSPQEAWAAANVDEDWQIAQWGEDGEAMLRRGRRQTELLAACRLLRLHRDGGGRSR